MKQLFITISTSILALFIGSSYYYYSPLYKKITNAVAVIHPTKGNKVTGIVKFSQESGGIRVKAQLQGLTPGEHGFHIHELGDCGCDDAVCAGDHFNPTGNPHGDRNDPATHVGDMGNVTADASGVAMYEYVDTKMTMNGPHSIIGRTVLVHAQADDFVSQPSGNSGARIGCGVIGLGKQAGT